METGILMKTSEYVPNLSLGSRVRFVGTHHPKSVQQCVIIRILPNPSERPQKQWYDVRFDDGSLGRFHENQLIVIVKDRQIGVA